MINLPIKNNTKMQSLDTLCHRRFEEKHKLQERIIHPPHKWTWERTRGPSRTDPPRN